MYDIQNIAKGRKRGRSIQSSCCKRRLVEIWTNSALLYAERLGAAGNQTPFLRMRLLRRPGRGKWPLFCRVLISPRAQTSRWGEGFLSFSRTHSGLTHSRNSPTHWCSWFPGSMEKGHRPSFNVDTHCGEWWPPAMNKNIFCLAFSFQSLLCGKINPPVAGGGQGEALGLVGLASSICLQG